METRQSAPEVREPLSGLVERVTFHNSDNGFCVLRVKVRGHRDLVTVLGEAPSIAAGEYIQASGRWENHRDHGQQFRATLLTVTPPTSTEGMERYLGSGLIKGIGPTFARRLVVALGEVWRSIGATGIIALYREGHCRLSVVLRGPRNAVKGGAEEWRSSSQRKNSMRSVPALINGPSVSLELAVEERIREFFDSLTWDQEELAYRLARRPPNLIFLDQA
jgi:hypothetical protein